MESRSEWIIALVIAFAVTACTVTASSDNNNATVTVLNCSCPTCPVETYQELTCHGPDTKGRHRVYDCLSQIHQCVHLSEYAATGCKNFSRFLTFVCNQCAKTGDSYTLVECNQYTEDATVKRNCDQDCKTCTGTATNYKYDECVPGAFDATGFNHGVTSCESVNISFYNVSSCATTPTSRWMMGQYECANEEMITCSRNPLLPVPDGSHVTVSTCPWNSNCVNCTDKVVESGQCFDSPVRFWLANHESDSQVQHGDVLVCGLGDVPLLRLPRGLPATSRLCAASARALGTRPRTPTYCAIPRR